MDGAPIVRASAARCTERDTRAFAHRLLSPGMERRNMTTMHIRQCPRCELRFTSSSELQDHLTNDHRPRRDVSDIVAASAPPPAVPNQTPVPAPPPVVGPAAAPRSRAL